MKRLLITIVLALFAVAGLSAQNVMKFKTTDFAYKFVNDYGYWTDWSDWEDCKVLIVVNFEKETIDIYSETTQEFDIYDFEEETIEDENGESMKMYCIDEDGVKCEVRIRVQSDGQEQLYVEYANIAYVYCMEER